MVGPVKAKLVSEASREREIQKFASYSVARLSHTRGAPGSDARYGQGSFSPDDGGSITAFTTTTSSDPTLTIFAQLGAFKLRATRCLISTFDRNKQYIIAEATQKTPLTSMTHDSEGIWLGGTSIPRGQTPCEHVLLEKMSADGPPPEAENTLTHPFLPVSIVPDLTQDSRFQCEGCIVPEPGNRFYAAVPVRSSRGINIGVYSVYDDKPRAKLDPTEICFLRDMSQSVMSYLELKRSTEAYKRSVRMVRGLGSFVEGESTISLLPLANTVKDDPADGEGRLNKRQQVLQQKARAKARGLSGVADEDENERAESNGRLDRMNIMDKMSRSVKPDMPSDRPSLIPQQPGAPETTAADCLAGGNKAMRTGSKTFHGVNAVNEGNTSDSSQSAEVPVKELNSVNSVNDTATKSWVEDSHHSDVRKVFSKAANIIREAIEVEGVIFLDASVSSFGGMVPRPSDGDSASSGDAAKDYFSNTWSDMPKSEPVTETTERTCEILGFSTSQQSSIDDQGATWPATVSERTLRALLRRYPYGKIFVLDEAGMPMSGDSEEEYGRSGVSAEGKLRNRRSREQEGKSVAAILPNARSVVLVPLWDPHKERWYAAGLCWTRTLDRVLTVEGELSYLRAFGMATMVEINRLATVMVERTKSDLLGSLSHELRSPLHGIVAAVELLQDTELDAFQGDLLHSMESCGRTLLDVIDHLLDYTNINKFIRGSKKSSNHVRNPRAFTGRQRKFESSLTSMLSDVEVDSLAEESIDSMYSGYNFQRMSIAQLVRREKSRHPDVAAIRHLDTISAVESLVHRQEKTGLLRLTQRAVGVYIDIDPRESWLHHTQAGALRRIIMNIFGNSLKYTDRGFIIVSMKQERVSDTPSKDQVNVKLVVTDSGKGIGKDFLHNQLFRPFSQEEPLNPGTGLGLSLVHQITKTLNGTIQVESEVGRGTRVTATLPLTKSQSDVVPDSTFGDNVKALTGLRVRLRGLKEEPDALGPNDWKPPSELDLIKRTCREWLHLEVVAADSADIRPDLCVISDAMLEGVGCNAEATPGVVICRDAMVARSLSRTSRSQGKTRVLEFISQPIGPRNLAKSLVLAMTRWVHIRGPMSLSHHGVILAQHVAESSTDTSATTVTGSPDHHATTPPAANFPFPDRPVGEAAAEAGSHGRYGDVTARGPQKDRCASSPHCLLVDDNKINLQILASFMNKMQRPWKSASNGLEALEMYAAHPGRYKYVLMDISMPVMDGLEATRRIRQLERAQKVEPATIIALTGLAAASTQSEAYASGMNLFVTKPVRLKELRKVLGEEVGH